jgi:hypothetical protein
MSHPDEEVLAAVALGDDPGLRPDLREHVRSCVECSATVASLREVVSYARAGADAPPMVAPPKDLWSRIELEVDAHAPREADASGSGRERTAAPPAAEPDVVRPIGSAPGATRDRAPRSRFPLPWAAGLAAAGIAIGLITGRALWQEQTPAVTRATTVATTRLDTLDTRQRLGDAALLRTDDGVDLQVATSPLDAGDGYLEVWLINSDGKRMVSIGVLRGDGPERFPISQTLIDQGYVIVDISREGFDDKPEHSGDSLARGTLPT